MIIHELRSKNVKRLKAVSFKPDGSLIIVGGDNGNGKSSFLDSIKYAVGGKKAHPTRPVREGANRAEIFIDMGDYTIECTITPAGRHVVKVYNAEGVEQRSPQALLDKLYDDLTFDPLEFNLMDKWARLKNLKKLVGLDFTEMDEKRAEIYAHRTQINRQLKESRVQYEELPEYPEAGFEQEGVEAVSKQLKEAEEHNSKYRELIGSAEKKRDKIKINLEKIGHLNEKIDFLIGERDALLKEQVDLDDGVMNDERAAEEHGEKDPSEIMEAFSKIHKQNEKVQANIVALAKREEVKSLEKIADTLTKQINEIDECKNNSMAKAVFPIKGLSFSSEGVLYNNIPYEQCAQSEQLRISVAMGLAMNPMLRVLLIRDGSLLDKNNRKLVAEMAAEADPPAQVWMECVGKDEDSTIIIEDGMIQEDESGQVV
jgi:DNA repair exonuclease SbcCD ATPase subunit